MLTTCLHSDLLHSEAKVAPSNSYGYIISKDGQTVFVDLYPKVLTFRIA